MARRRICRSNVGPSAISSKRTFVDILILFERFASLAPQILLKAPICRLYGTIRTIRSHWKQRAFCFFHKTSNLSPARARLRPSTTVCPMICSDYPQKGRWCLSCSCARKDDLTTLQKSICSCAVATPPHIAPRAGGNLTDGQIITGSVGRNAANTRDQTL